MSEHHNFKIMKMLDDGWGSRWVDPQFGTVSEKKVRQHVRDVQAAMAALRTETEPVAKSVLNHVYFDTNNPLTSWEAHVDFTGVDRSFVRFTGIVKTPGGSEIREDEVVFF